MHSFSARMPWLMAISTFGLGKRRWSSQQCYLLCLRTVLRTSSRAKNHAYGENSRHRHDLQQQDYHCTK